MAESFHKLAETRDRNLSDGGVKLVCFLCPHTPCCRHHDNKTHTHTHTPSQKFADWMVEQVASSLETQLKESLGGIVQDEIRMEMTYGDQTEPPEQRVTMETVLRKWRDGVYDENRLKTEEDRYKQRMKANSIPTHSHDAATEASRPFTPAGE